MKKILTLFLVSALGGIFTLGTYKLYLEEEKPVFVTSESANPSFIPTSSVNTIGKKEALIDFTVAAENTVNAVVHVKNVTISTGESTMEDLISGKSSERVLIDTGSGVIINADGYIITNNHVIKEAHELTVTLNNNKTYTAKLIGADAITDIALLKIEADEDLPFVTFADSDNAKIGDWVLAVGNPFNLTSTVTAGIISAKARDLSGTKNQSFIQTDAAVNPGNSGGALVNTKGRLIGINTAISSQTGSYVGYSFAVTSNIARKVIEDILKYGNVQNGILGIQGGALNSIMAKKIGITDTEGVYIDSVVEDSGAAKGGVQKGDIIKEIDNIKVSKFSDLSGYLSAKGPDDIVSLKVSRDGNIKTIPVTLAKNNTFTMPLVGSIKNARSSDLKKFKAHHGVKITELDSQYIDYWKKNGIQEGCIITSINDLKIKNILDVQKALKNQSNSEAMRLELINSNGDLERYNFR